MAVLLLVFLYACSSAPDAAVLMPNLASCEAIRGAVAADVAALAGTSATAACRAPGAPANPDDACGAY